MLTVERILELILTVCIVAVALNDHTSTLRVLGPIA